MGSRANAMASSAQPYASADARLAADQGAIAPRFLDGLPPFPLPASAAGVAAALGRIGKFEAALWPVERAAAATMKPHRAAAYASGRRAAHAALAALGVGARPVTSCGRKPRWPAGVVGSIAHSRALAVAVVARRRQALGVGVDVEAEGRVGARLAKRVLVDPERRRLAQAHWTLAFSAKEAVYKAVNPVVGEYLGFGDVQIEIAGETFSAVAVPGRESAAMVAAGAGFFRQVCGHWLTVFVCR